MDYQIGDIVEVNFNGCLWPDLPPVECEVLKTKPNFTGVYLLKLPEGFDPIWTMRIKMKTEDTFVCHRDWFRLVQAKPIPVDVSNLL